MIRNTHCNRRSTFKMVKGYNTDVFNQLFLFFLDCVLFLQKSLNVGEFVSRIVFIMLKGVMGN